MRNAKIGDTVDFKCDTEQEGEVVAITGSGAHRELQLKSHYERGFLGGYIGGDEYTWQTERRCWSQEEEG